MNSLYGGDMVVIWYLNIGEMVVKWWRWMNDEWVMVDGGGKKWHAGFAHCLNLFIFAETKT